ncbi:Armadillo repeat-containing protein 1 [Halocaridina rubra]|uniref:Armadillo repeat-containing protein 1 n=1 Tax=Halocaridina rubra TaxID=373956 RepID=A0AAN8WQE2_HALRR
MGEIDLGAAAEATIQAYRELASDPAKRLALALDRTCIQFLAYVVAEGEATLVHLAVETLSLISQAQECRTSLANTFGVLEALQAVSEDESNYSEDLRDKATGLFTSLQFARCVKKTPSPDKVLDNPGTSNENSKHPDDVDSTISTAEETANRGSVSSTEQTSNSSGSPVKSDAKSDSSKKSVDSGNSLADNKSEPKEDASRTANSHPAVEKKSSFLGPNNSKAKIVTLYIKGMVNPYIIFLMKKSCSAVVRMLSLRSDKPVFKLTAVR